MPEHPISGTFACWGVNDAGQLGDGTVTSRVMGTAQRFELGKVTDLAIGERHACAVFGKRTVACWGDGARGQLGRPLTQSLAPVVLGEGSFSGESIAVGGAHTCLRVDGDHLSCFGADDEGQLGGSAVYPSSSKDWSRDARIRAFALGQAHTCVAYDPSGETRSGVVCRGRASAAPREPVLAGVAVKELTAGKDHTCALVEDGSVRCWGKNDAGQLGDGTTNDAATPVTVVALPGAVQVAAGARHTCALLRNGTVACWGDNSFHQLASGTTERSTRPNVVVGIVKAKELSLGGDGACVRLDGGYVRCWGKNDRGQLGDGTTVEHSVPMPIRFH